MGLDAFTVWCTAALSLTLNLGPTEDLETWSLETGDLEPGTNQPQSQWGFEIRVFLLLSEVANKANEPPHTQGYRYYTFPKGPTGCTLTSYPGHGQAAGAAPVRQLIRQQLHGHLLVLLVRRYGWTMEMTSLKRSKEKQRKK